MGSFFMSNLSYDENYVKYQKEPNLEALDGHEGIADEIDLFALDLLDGEITESLNNRINDSRTFWNDSSSYDLKRRRERNARFVMGDHWHDVPIIGQHIPYVQNEIYTAEQVISAYVTAKLPEIEAYPGTDKPESKHLAQDVAAMMRWHSEEHGLQEILCNIVLSLMNDYVGLIEFIWDPNCGKFGDIIPKFVDPANVIIDKRAAQRENPTFICITKQHPAEELCAQFPKKAKDIMDKVGDKKQAIITYRTVWVTYYENNKACDGVVYYFENFVLGKSKNPHWIYDEKAEGASNVLPYAMKPFIPFNYINDGKHWIDRYGPIDQAIPIQLMIDRIGKQIQQGVSHSSPVLIFNKRALSKPNADKVTGQPWEKILVDAEDVTKAYGVIQANQVPNFVVNEIERLVEALHKLFGTPPQLQGGANQSQTATQDIMARNQAQGRQDLLVRAIDRGLDSYFKYLLQMMKVYYTEDHYASVLGEDGKYDFVALNRNSIEEGMKVSVKAGSTLPNDKAGMQAVALNLAKMNRISNLSLYEFLDIPNAGKHVERLVKEQVDAVSTVEEIRNDDQDRKAVEDYENIKAGQPAPPRDDVDMKHIATHHRQVLSNDFNDPNQWTPEAQAVLKEHTQTEIEKLKALMGITNDQLYPQPPPPPPDPSVPVSINGQPAAPGTQPTSPPIGAPPIPNADQPMAPNLANPMAIPAV